MEFVVNEWLLDYLTPKASQSESASVRTFLFKFYQKQDILFVKYNSPFTQKAYGYPKLYSGYQESEMMSFFLDKILLNSQKCRLLYDDEITGLPNPLNDLLIPPYDSDTYLFEASLNSTNKIVVTTDQRLIQQTKNNGQIKVVHLIEFLQSY